ncbi:hypothetical protein [Metamycoplasma equirhinis]|uniref:hypothetical protein n=1 Tax=Metamycoplasma equirhinis TaxID=92402 RepID=UPI002573980A|nr:hypothetical protein [Metamycoplasma equirhinis]
MRSEIETFKNTDVKAAQDMIKEARDYVEKGWQDKEFKLHQLDEKLKNVEQFISNHQTINENDKDEWLNQKTIIDNISSDVQDQNSIFNNFHNYEYQANHPNVQSLANGIQNRWQDAKTKISKALEEIEKKIAAKKFYDKAKEEIQNLKWISNSKRDQKLKDLNDNKNDLSRMQQILNDAKNADEITQKLILENKNLSEKIKQLPINEKLFDAKEWMNQQYSFENERSQLNTLYNDNYIDYHNDVDDDTIRAKNSKMKTEFYPIVDTIINKSKQLLGSMYNDFKGWTINASFVTKAYDIMQKHDKDNRNPFFAYARKMEIESSNYRTQEIEKLPSSTSDSNYQLIIDKINKTAKWFKEATNNYFYTHKEDVLKYYQKINSFVENFENTKYFQLPHMQNMYKYDEVKKLYKNLLDTSGTEIYKLLYEKADNYTFDGATSEFTKFEKLYKNIEYQVEKKFNEINLKEFVEHLTDFKWENSQDKLISELVKDANHQIGEYIKFNISKGSYKTPLNYKIQNLQTLGNLGNVDGLKENNYAIYEGFGLNIDDIKYSDIDGKLQFNLSAFVRNKYFDPNKNNSEVINGSKHTYTIIEFTKISKRTFNVHAHAEKSSNNTNNKFTRIEQLIALLKSYKPEVNGTNEHNIKQIFNFTGLPNDETIIRIDHNSLRDLGSGKLGFKLKFFKSNVPHIENNEQKYIDFELDSRELTVDFASTLQENIRAFLKNQQVNYKYIGSKPMGNLLASDATPSDFAPIHNSNNLDYDWNLVSVVGDDEHGKARLQIRLRSKLFSGITHEYYQEISNFKKDEPSEIKALVESDYNITNKVMLASTKEKELSDYLDYNISKYSNITEWFKEILSNSGKGKFDAIIEAEMDNEDYKLKVTYFVKKTVKTYTGVKDIKKQYTTTLDLSWFLEPLHLIRFFSDITQIREKLSRFQVLANNQNWTIEEYINYKHENKTPTEGIKEYAKVYKKLYESLVYTGPITPPLERNDAGWQNLKERYKNIKQNLVELLQLSLIFVYKNQGMDDTEAARIFSYWMKKDDARWKALAQDPGPVELARYLYIYYPKYLLRFTKDWKLALNQKKNIEYFLHDAYNSWPLPDYLKEK